MSGVVLGVMHIIQVVGSLEMGYGHVFQASTSCFAFGHASCPRIRFFAESLPFQKHISLWYQYHQFCKGAKQSNSSLFTSTGEGLE